MAIKQDTADATVRVNYDGKQAEAGLKGLKGALGGLQKTVANVSMAYAGMLVLRKVSAAVKEYTDLAKIQIQAEQALSAALGYTSQALLEHASALQRVTTYGDEQIIQAQALIAAFIKEEDQIKKITPAILDMAAAKGMDLRSAADLVTKSVASSTNALTRYGIEITGAAGSSERLQSAVDGLTKHFGGMAEELAKTDVGRIEQIKNEIGDIKETFGMYILPYQRQWNQLLLDAAKLTSQLFMSTKPEFIRQQIEAAEAPAEAAIRKREEILKNIERLSRGYGRAAQERVHEEGSATEALKTQLKVVDSIIEKYKELYAVQPATPEETTKTISPEALKAAEEDVAAARKFVMEQSIDGRMKLLREETAKRVELARSAGVSVVQIWQEHNIKMKALQEQQRAEAFSKLSVDSLWIQYGALPESLMEGVRKGLEDRDKLREQQDAEETSDNERRLALHEKAMSEIRRTDQENYNARLAEVKNYFDEGVILESDYLRLVQQINDDYRATEKQKTEEFLAEKELMYRSNRDAVVGVTSSLMSLSNTYTEYELNQARKRSKNSEEYEKAREKITQEAAQRQYNFAVWQQGIRLVDSVQAAASGIIKSAESGASAGVVGAIISAALAAVEFGILLSNVQQAPSPPPPSMATGGMQGGRRKTRQTDDIGVLLGAGERVMDAPATDKYYDELESMARGTFDRKYGGASYNYNLYGVSNEQFLQLTVANERRNQRGMRL